MTKSKKAFLEILKSYRPTSFEKECLSELVEHVKNNDDCFERNHIEGAKHISASVLLINQNNEILLLWHKKIQQWVQPGGHCDGNSNIIQVALDELKEETSIKLNTLDPEPIEIRKYTYESHVFGYSKSIYNVMYLGFVNTNEQTPRVCEPDKCEKMIWMSVNDAIQELSKSPYPNPTHALEKLKERLRLPDKLFA